MRPYILIRGGTFAPIEDCRIVYLTDAEAEEAVSDNSFFATLPWGRYRDIDELPYLNEKEDE